MAQGLRQTRLAVWQSTLALGVLASAGACGHEHEEDAFASKVVPLLEKRCASSACHGVAATAAPSMQLDAQRWLTFTTDAQGRIVGLPAARASLLAKINSTDGVDTSSLLRKTLPVPLGGERHYKDAVFPARTDADFQTLRTWASTEKGSEGRADPPLTPLEKRFQDDVYPTLVDRGCATATCHGGLNFGGAVFEAPAVPATRTISKTALRRTYVEARRNITLWGRPERSRLLAKMLPLDKGGMAHKGGNDMFFAADTEAGQDPRQSAAVKGVLDWIAAERAAVKWAPPATAPADPPLVAVGGPLQTGDVFQVPTWTPGTELYRLDPPYTGGAVNLTAAHHAGAADIRDPTLNHAGTRVVFAMRKAVDDAFNLYAMNLDGSGLQALTFDKPGDARRPVANLGPIFGPNGGHRTAGKAADERLYFSSFRGDASDLAAYPNADLYAMDPDGAGQERLTWTCQPELAASLLSSGEFQGSLVYTIKRAAGAGYKGVLFRFPPDHNSAHHVQPEAHPHFGMSEPPHAFWQVRELPDGRQAMILLDSGNLARGGPLAVLERQFAVEVPVGEEAQATLPGFRHALAVLTPQVARGGLSADGFWRDPAPLPDGRIVAAHAPGPIDLSAPPASVRTRLELVTLKEDAKTQQPVVASLTVLRDDPAVAWSQAVPVGQRPAEDDDHPRMWNDKDTSATLVHSGVQTIEAVLAQLPPVAARTVRTDLAVVRAVAPVAAAGKVDDAPVPATETEFGLSGATRASLLGRAPLFAAAEVPPAADGSLAAHIPAQVPVRLMTLGKDGYALGAQQQQWYAAAPGERFPVGIGPASFNARCAGCHGALDGKKETVLQPPTDVVTQASVTLALYEDADRRKPKTLPTVGPTMFEFADFAQHVQPILDTKCATAGCHAATSPPGGLRLDSAATKHFSQAYEHVLKPGTGSGGSGKYVDTATTLARKSALAERLLGIELEAAAAVTGACPPSGAPPLTDTERRRLLRWIELGAPWTGVPAK